MTNAEIIEANKFIAQFMGAEIKEEKFTVLPMACFSSPPDSKQKFTSYELHLLEYSTSWDWLMPVVEKIEAEHAQIHVTENICFILSAKENFNKIKVEAEIKIKAVYQAVIEFIKWYNLQAK